MNDNTESTISVTIRPGGEISKVVVDVQESLDVRYPDHEDSFPHSTLYSCRFDEAKYPELLESLKAIDTPAFEGTIENVKFEDNPLRNNTFVSLSFTNASQFIELHNTVLDIANPLRGGLVRTKDIERYKNGKMTEEGWAATQKYGFQYFREKYYPHITIGVIQTDDIAKKEALMQKLSVLAGKTFAVDTLLVKMKRRTMPDEIVVFASEITEVSLQG